MIENEQSLFRYVVNPVKMPIDNWERAEERIRQFYAEGRIDDIVDMARICFEAGTQAMKLQAKTIAMYTDTFVWRFEKIAFGYKSSDRRLIAHLHLAGYDNLFIRDYLEKHTRTLAKSSIRSVVDTVTREIDIELEKISIEHRAFVQEAFLASLQLNDVTGEITRPSTIEY